MIEIPLTPISLRCRRKALGLTRAELGDIIGAPENAIRSWEIGKSMPRDQKSVNMLLSSLEVAALDCVDALTTPADCEIEDGDVSPVVLISYVDQVAYEQGCEWAARLPLSTYQACVGNAAALLADHGLNVSIIHTQDKERA